jgi:hypothetical protein
LSIILVVFGLQISSQNDTFALLAAEGQWDINQKSRCCFTAAIFYAVVSSLMLLWHRWRLHAGSLTKRRNAARIAQSPPRDSSPLLSANRF